MSCVSRSSFASRQPVLDVASSSPSPQPTGFTGVTPEASGSDPSPDLPLGGATQAIQSTLESLNKGRRGADFAAFHAVLERVPADADSASAAVLTLFKAIAQAHDLIVALPPQAGGVQAHARATDEQRFIDVFTAAMQAAVSRFVWFDNPELQWHVIESLPCSAQADEGHAQDLGATRAMMSAWLSYGFAGSPSTKEMAKLVSGLLATVNRNVPASWLDAVLAGLLDAYTGPPKSESKSKLAAFLSRGDSKSSGGDRIAACDALIDCLGHQLHRLTPEQIEGATTCLARHMGHKADPLAVVRGLAHRLLDGLLGYTDSRSRQWAAVLTGCHAGLLAAGGERPDKAKAESKSEVAVDPQQHTQTVTAALDALVTWASKHHAKRVQGREATLRQCVRTGLLPQASASHGALQPQASSITTTSNNETINTIAATSTTTNQPASTLSSSVQPVQTPVLESSTRTDAS
ncbi:MAG: hypothetical protein V4609_18895 [Pseudomonadota bacterium]